MINRMDKTMIFKKNYSYLTLLLVAIFAVLFSCAYGTVTPDSSLHSNMYICNSSFYSGHSDDEIRTAVQHIVSTFNPDTYYPEIDILAPFDGTLFPRDIASPTFKWHDQFSHSSSWLIIFRFEDTKHRICVVTDRTTWTPDEKVWNIIKRYSLEKKGYVTIIGISSERRGEITSRNTIMISTSKDEVGAPILYMQMHLPFARAKKHPELSQWRLGAVSSYKEPSVVLKNVSSCGNCHHVSRNGKVFGMDIDHKKDKGTYALSEICNNMALTEKDLISWNDFQRSDTSKSMGLFSKISPDGTFVVSTVKETSFFAMLSDLDFSQFFFPVRGLVACYSIPEKRFFTLSGADDPDYVQTCPEWSPDGRYVVFSRAKVNTRLLEVLGGKDYINVGPEVRISDLNKKYQIRFNLYKLPFNNGKGGIPEPVAGASHNGNSNYFPRYSPDGRWIILTKSETGLAIQPDSTLHIIPAEGGTARKLRCNTDIMNSWHSWSPNSRWLVFASKVNTPYTELFLTHIDEEGNDSPPVLLSRFNTDSYAALVPELINIKIGAIKKITFSITQKQ